jgi:homocysteine S-methyltransferase
MGTMLYSKGIYINRSYDELNLVAADLVREVHAEYVRAGADIIETIPTEQCQQLPALRPGSKPARNQCRAAQIAREAAGNRAFVAGAVGPLAAN